MISKSASLGAAPKNIAASLPLSACLHRLLPYDSSTIAMLHEAEWQTRKNRIDSKLRNLNPPWQIVPWRDGLDTTALSCHAVTELPTENGPADYALFVGGKLLGISEAKKVTVNPQNVLEQAKRYAQRLSHRACLK